MPEKLKQLTLTVDNNKITKEDFERLHSRSERSVTAAQIVIVTVPIVVAYPYLQRCPSKGLC